MNLFRCTQCLYPNTKPDLHFNSDGLCSACQAYQARKNVDWAARRQEFVKLIHGLPNGSHDVVVACSGGKDSTWQIVKCLELGLRPLAVTATTDDLSPLGRKNLDNVKELCDHVEVSVHLPTRRKIAAFALREIGDISWAEHTLIWSVPAREAVQRGIAVVLYGENPQNEYGAGPKGSEGLTQLDSNWVHEFGGLLGLRLSDVGEILGIEPRHLELYRHPAHDMDVVRCLWMGSYFPWDGYENAVIAEEYGFTWSREPVRGTGVHYENLDNHQTGIHDYLRFLKFGYGRACDVASNLIRRGSISRDEGIEFVGLHDGAWPKQYLGKSLGSILRLLGITTKEFDAICERFTNEAVIDWVSNPASYQCFYGTNTAASKASSSTQAAA